MDITTLHGKEITYAVNMHHPHRTVYTMDIYDREGRVMWNYLSKTKGHTYINRSIPETLELIKNGIYVIITPIHELWI